MTTPEAIQKRRSRQKLYRIRHAEQIAVRRKMYEQRPEVHERRRIQRNAANQRFEVKLKRKQVYEENGKEQKKFRMISDAFFRSAFDQMSPKHRAKIRYILRRQAGSAISIPDSLIVLKSKQVKLKSILNEKLK